MSRTDYETGDDLNKVYIEISSEDRPRIFARINSKTLDSVFDDISPLFKKGEYVVYTMVTRFITTTGKGRIAQTSRTVMGYLSEDIVKEKLPNVYSHLKREDLEDEKKPDNFVAF